jgi:hypothetical protein
MKEKILACFRLALQVNGETHGGTYERVLLRGFLSNFPEYLPELQQAALTWAGADRLADPESWNDLAERRIKDVCAEFELNQLKVVHDYLERKTDPRD